MTSDDLKVGREYMVSHDRKGKFSGILKHYDETWMVFFLTSDDLDERDELVVRRSFCKILENN